MCGVGEHKNLHNRPICRSFEETKVCREKPCPVDCKFSWNSWGTCSVTCGGGRQFRTPLVKTIARHGGKECTGIQKRSCKAKECPTMASDLTSTSAVTTTKAERSTTSEHKTTTPVFPLNEVEEVVVNAVQSLGCVFILGSLTVTLAVFLILRYYSTMLLHGVFRSLPCLHCFRDFSHERCLHMNMEIALLLTNLLVLTLRDRTEWPVSACSSAV